MKYVFLLMMIIGASFSVMAEDLNEVDCNSISQTTIDANNKTTILSGNDNKDTKQE